MRNVLKEECEIGTSPRKTKELSRSTDLPRGVALRLGVKSLFDVLFALLCIIFFSPFILMIILILAFISDGPVFYRSRRVGQQGKIFEMLKFRTMVPHGDQLLANFLDRNQEQREFWQRDQKLLDDPRVTRLGMFLRRTSLDELPQFINILKGEMSIVGPRPCEPCQEPEYGDAFQCYIQMRPGITGLWQVSGRNTTTFAERVVYDAEYVRQWSLFGDFKILFKTIGVVFSGNGAY